MIGGLIALAASFYLGGGWVYANKLRADALVPRPPTHDFGVWVTDVNDRTITLWAEEARQDVTHPGLIGVYWEGGYGQVGEILESGETSVVRTFTSVTGASPPLCTSSDLSSCEPVDLEGWAYQSDPSDVGLQFSEAVFDSRLGPLGAWVVPADHAKTWVIHVHGWSAARREAVRMLPGYHRNGITSMVIDYRNDPGAPRDPSGHYRFGLSEWKDLDSAVEYARNHGAERVILAGYSTGAAVVMAFSERSDQMEHVEALVFDAPNVDMRRAVHFAAALETLPILPFKVPASLTSVAMAITNLRWGVDWNAIDYIDAAPRLSIPVLVFHGEADGTVPIAVSREFAAANPAHVELVEVPDAAHVMSWNADPTRYEERLEHFLGSL